MCRTQIMSLLDYSSKESQDDLVVLSRVPDLKVVLTFASPSINIHLDKPHTLHKHCIDPTVFLTHTQLRPPHTLTHHAYTHTHRPPHTQTDAHPPTPRPPSTHTYQFLQETVSVLAAFQWTHFPAVIHRITSQHNSTSHNTDIVRIIYYTNIMLL